MPSVLSLNSSIFSLARVRPTKADVVSASCAAITMLLFAFSAELFSAALTFGDGFETARLAFRVSGALEALGEGLLSALILTSGLLVLISALLPREASARLFIRLDARVAARALRLFVSASILFFVLEACGLEPSLESFFIVSAYAFAPEHPKKARRIAVGAAAAALATYATALFLPGHASGSALAGDIETLICALFSLRLVNALGVRVPR